MSESAVNHVQEIETWVKALNHYDNKEFEEALKVFNNIPDTSKILFNCGVIYATLGWHDQAVCPDSFCSAVLYPGAKRPNPLTK